MYTDANGQVHGQLAKDWEVVINKKDLLAWRKPVPNTELYEYKSKHQSLTFSDFRI